jgi:hypothetical protein
MKNKPLQSLDMLWYYSGALEKRKKRNYKGGAANVQKM